MKLRIELKVWRAGEPDPLNDGLEQLDGYLAGLGLDERGAARSTDNSC